MSALLVWEVLCVALLWSAFCRSVLVDKTTRTDVRLAVWGIGIASLVGIAAPLYGWEPDIVTMGIVFAIVCMQAVMAKHWKNGVPEHFIQDAYRHRRRFRDHA